jgi:hypothetical protein
VGVVDEQHGVIGQHGVLVDAGRTHTSLFVGRGDGLEQHGLAGAAGPDDRGGHRATRCGRDLPEDPGSTGKDLFRAGRWLAHDTGPCAIR